jgi:hypothetical protein
MSGEHADFTSRVWAQASPSHPVGSGLVVCDPGVRAAFGLLIKSLPYAFARFGILSVWSVGCILWLVAAVSGARAISAQIAPALGPAWLLACLAAAIWVWATTLRRALHFLACGQVAVLTALITRGRAGTGRGSMLGYGEAVVSRRFGEMPVLFGMNRLMRCNLRAFHASLDWTLQETSGRRSGSDAVLRFFGLSMLTGYLDKVIVSYNLARGDGDSWAVMREGFVYYAQNAGPLLTSWARIALLEQVSTWGLALLLLAPAVAVTFVLPDEARPLGGTIAVLSAILLATALRSAFLKPLFLIMMIVRFHLTIEDQAIDQDWQDRLASIPGTFGTLAPGFVMPRGMRGFWPGGEGRQ